MRKTKVQTLSHAIGFSYSKHMVPEKFNLRHLRGLARIAETGSVTHGAALANMSQPALTQAISKLEERFAVSLFYRESNGLFPTDAGSRFIARAEAALQCLRVGVKRASLMARREGHTVSSFENLITMTQIRSFVAVAKARNYSLAARQSGLSQPSIHRSAKELEQIVDFPLYLKAKQGIELTDAAKPLAHYFPLMLTELRYGLEEISSLSGVETTRITVGAMPFARSQLLPDAIIRFLKEHPKVDFFVQDGMFSDLLHNLRIGELDLLVGALREMPPADDVVQHHLFDDQLAIISGAHHPVLQMRNLSWRDLCKFSWVIPRAGTPTRQYFDQMTLHVANPADLHVVETSSLAMVRGLLLGGDFLTVSSLNQIDTENRLGLLKRVNVDLVGADRQIGMTTRSNWSPTPLRQRFINVLRSEGQRLGSVQSCYSENE